MSGKVSSQLNEAIEGFLKNSGDIAAHLANVSNPHAVTKTQVGLSNVTNDKQATEAQLQTHTGNVSNPHSVTKTQVGLSNVTNDKQATEANLNAHTANVNNPHGVTKTQVGLGNVVNAEQATKAEYNSHVAGTADKHSATDIVYDELHNVKEYIDQLALESGTGTMDHSLLQNRDLTNAHPASAITGLLDVIGYETYTFYGEAPDSTEIELFTTDTGAHIDSNGRIKFTGAETLAFEAYIIAGAKPNVDRINASTLIKKTGIVRRVTASVATIHVDEGITVGNSSDVSVNIAVDGGSAETAATMSIKVSQTGAIDLGWKAIVKVIPLSYDEFI